MQKLANLMCGILGHPVVDPGGRGERWYPPLGLEYSF